MASCAAEWSWPTTPPQVTGAPVQAVAASKLRAPAQPELAIGAVTAEGPIYLDQGAIEHLEISTQYLDSEVLDRASPGRRQPGPVRPNRGRSNARYRSCSRRRSGHRRDRNCRRPPAAQAGSGAAGRGGSGRAPGRRCRSSRETNSMAPSACTPHSGFGAVGRFFARFRGRFRKHNWRDWRAPPVRVGSRFPAIAIRHPRCGSGRGRLQPMKFGSGRPPF